MMKRLVIYFHYDPRGQADEACRFAVRAVREQAQAVLFVTNGRLADESRAWAARAGLQLLDGVAAEEVDGGLHLDGRGGGVLGGGAGHGRGGLGFAGDGSGVPFGRILPLQRVNFLYKFVLQHNVILSFLVNNVYWLIFVALPPSESILEGVVATDVCRPMSRTCAGRCCGRP